MSTEERAKAAAKNVEGKAQEGLSKVTGDPEDKTKGKAKQTEAGARNIKEDVKDAFK
ncbi:MAG: CsbD family protein [Cyanobacteria bacterium Co-bin13]|nr:CsbD family protein [Cyanobacteria bacterium Co-bin13]